MKNPFTKGVLTVAVLLIMATAARAAITAQELRDAMIEFYEMTGYQVTVGSERRAGDTLVLEDVTLSQELPDGAGQAVLKMGEILMRETGDGAVVVEPSPLMTLEMTINDGSDTGTVLIDIMQSGASTRASGSMDALKLVNRIAGMTVTLRSLTMDGKPVPLNASASLARMEGTYTILRRSDGKKRISGDSSIRAIEVKADAREDSGGEGSFEASFAVRDMVGIFSFEGKITRNPEEMLAAGFAMDSKLDYGKTAIRVDFRDGAQMFRLNQNSEGGLFGFAMSKDAIAYEVGQKKTATVLASSDLPFPEVTVGYDEFAISFNLPLSRSDTPRDFHARAALRGLTVGDAVWSMFDPGGQLPRDPATVAIALAGKLKVLVDLMDPAQIEKLDRMQESPFVPVELTLEELTVSFGGASLTGEGQATFDPDSPIRVEGMPLPVGQIRLRLEGGFGLLDTLTAMGLVPPDAATGFRAMLGAFAKPVGDDQLESVIEMNEQGQVSANGIPLQ